MVKKKNKKEITKRKSFRFSPADTMNVIFNKLNEEKIDLTTATISFEYDYGCGCDLCGDSSASVDSIEIEGEVLNG